MTGPTLDELRGEIARWRRLATEHPTWATRANSEIRRLNIAVVRRELELEQLRG